MGGSQWERGKPYQSRVMKLLKIYFFRRVIWKENVRGQWTAGILQTRKFLSRMDIFKSLEHSEIHPRRLKNLAADILNWTVCSVEKKWCWWGEVPFYWKKNSNAIHVLSAEKAKYPMWVQGMNYKLISIVSAPEKIMKQLLLGSIPNMWRIGKVSGLVSTHLQRVWPT